MRPSCHTLSKAFEISKKQLKHQEVDYNQMMHILCELWREADNHMNYMVENQTDFHKASCFLVDIQILN